MGEPMDFQILGPLQVRRGDNVIKVATKRRRALLVLLLINAGRAVSAERLIDQLWDGEPPAQAAVTLRSYISHLRHELNGHQAGPGVLVTQGSGYAVDVDPDAVDAGRLERLAEQGRSQLHRGEAAAALETFTTALALWRGEPLLDIADHRAAQSLIARVRELHLAVQEGRFEAMLRTGRHLDALPSLESFVSDHPLREAPRAQLMLALYRAGRAPEALEVYARFRRLLDDELGLDPSSSLDGLRQQILLQDAGLEAPPPQVESVQAQRPEPQLTRAATEAEVPGKLADSSVVGRQRELRALRGSLDRLVEGGQGALVLIGGEPGIGKTTLLGQLRTMAVESGLSVHWGRSPSGSGAPAFWPWTQVISSIAAGLDDEELARATAGAGAAVTQLVPEVAERLGRRDQVGGDSPQESRFLLYDAMSTFLAHAGRRAPTVLLLEDLHLADAPSLEMLTYLTPRLPDARILAATSYRDLASERTVELNNALAIMSREDAVQEMSLQGLPHSDVAALAAAVSGGDPPAEVITALHERTAGNPFFVRQLAQLMLETGDSAAGARMSQLPPGVYHVLTSRLDALVPETRSLLDVAAVVGREFDVRVVAAAGQTTVLDALDTLDVAVRHGLIEAGADPFTGYRFIHALVQEVVYGDLAPGRAAKLHARVATAMEGVGAPLDQLAEQMWRAADLIPDGRPLRHTLAAAEQARGLFAYEQAEVYLRRAVRLIEKSTPRDSQRELEVLMDLFQLIATYRGWGTADARDVVMRARELADGSVLGQRQFRMWWSLWWSLLDSHQLDMSDEIALTVMRSAQAAGEPVQLCVGHTMMTFRYLHRSELELALQEHAHARAASANVTDQEAANFAENLKVVIAFNGTQIASFLGETDAHLKNAEETVALAEADGRPFPRAIAHTFTATSSALVGDARHASARAADALDLADRFGFHVLTTVAGNAQAWASAELGGDVAAAVQRISEGVERFRRVGHVSSATHALVMLADVFVLAGEPEKARECLREARTAPGPYGCLMLRYLERKTAQLTAEVDDVRRA